MVWQNRGGVHSFNIILYTIEIPADVPADHDFPNSLQISVLQIGSVAELLWTWKPYLKTPTLSWRRPHDDRCSGLSCECLHLLLLLSRGHGIMDQARYNLFWIAEAELFPRPAAGDLLNQRCLKLSSGPCNWSICDLCPFQQGSPAMLYLSFILLCHG